MDHRTLNPFVDRLATRGFPDLNSFQDAFRPVYDPQDLYNDQLVARRFGDNRELFIPYQHEQTKENQEAIEAALAKAAIPPVCDGIDDGYVYLIPMQQYRQTLVRPQGGVPGYDPDSFVGEWRINPEKEFTLDFLPAPYPTVPGLNKATPQGAKRPRQEKRGVHHSEANFAHDQQRDVAGKIRDIQEKGGKISRKDRRAIRKTNRWVRKFGKH